MSSASSRSKDAAIRDSSHGEDGTAPIATSGIAMEAAGANGANAATGRSDAALNPPELSLDNTARDLALAPGSTAPPEAVYGPEDAEVLPPQIVSASLGGQRMATSPDRIVEVELVIDKAGNIESARIVPDASATLADAMLSTFALHSIRDWRFQPAVRYGSAVRYRQSVWFKGNGERTTHP